MKNNRRLDKQQHRSFSVSVRLNTISSVGVQHKSRLTALIADAGTHLVTTDRFSAGIFSADYLLGFSHPSQADWRPTTTTLHTWKPSGDSAVIHPRAEVACQPSYPTLLS
jgi:hypothetical protein